MYCNRLYQTHFVHHMNIRVINKLQYIFLIHSVAVPALRAMTASYPPCVWYVGWWSAPRATAVRQRSKTWRWGPPQSTPTGAAQVWESCSGKFLHLFCWKKFSYYCITLVSNYSWPMSLPIYMKYFWYL